MTCSDECCLTFGSLATFGALNEARVARPLVALLGLQVASLPALFVNLMVDGMVSISEKLLRSVQNETSLMQHSLERTAQSGVLIGKVLH